MIGGSQQRGDGREECWQIDRILFSLFNIACESISSHLPSRTDPLHVRRLSKTPYEIKVIEDTF
jgi:hypothetical protein